MHNKPVEEHSIEELTKWLREECKEAFDTETAFTMLIEFLDAMGVLVALSQRSPELIAAVQAFWVEKQLSRDRNKQITEEVSRILNSLRKR